MKRYFLFIVLALSISAQGQSGNKNRNNGQLKKLVIDDSTAKKIQRIKDSAINAMGLMDSTAIREDISRSVHQMVELQQQHESRKKKSAFVRIAIGLAMLVVLVIGLRRKKK